MINSTPVRECAPQSDWQSRRLWSLWDMLIRNAKYFLDLGARFNYLSTVYYMASVDAEHPLKEEETQDALEHLRGVLGLCRDLRLTTSYELIGRRVDQQAPPKTAGEFMLLQEAVNAELKSRHFAYVQSDRFPYTEGHKLASKEVQDAFPLAYFEIQRGAHCYALEEPTAAVFHAMRAAEIGLRALASDLHLTFPKPIEQMDWMPILNGIQGEIRAIENESVQNRPTRDADLAFYGEATVQLRAFKNAWRHNVAHARENYSDQQAKDVIDHVVAFFETLAPRLREPPA